MTRPSPYDAIRAEAFNAVLSMTGPLIDREVASHDYADALRRADTRGQAEAAKRVKAATCRIMGAV